MNARPSAIRRNSSDSDERPLQEDGRPSPYWKTVLENKYFMLKFIDELPAKNSPFLLPYYKLFGKKTIAPSLREQCNGNVSIFLYTPDKAQAMFEWLSAHSPDDNYQYQYMKNGGVWSDKSGKMWLSLEQWCKEFERILNRETTPLVVCPECGAKIGSACKRPSNHEFYGGEIHRARLDKLDELYYSRKALPRLRTLMKIPTKFRLPPIPYFLKRADMPKPKSSRKIPQQQSLFNPRRRRRNSDSPEVAAAKQDIIEMEQFRERMKAANRVVRSKKLSKDEKLAKLKSMGESPTLLEPDFAGRLGYAPYQLTNLGATIRSRKKKIETLLKREGADRTMREAFVSDSVLEEGPTFETDEGVTFIYNVDMNRLQLEFDGKPPDDVRKVLKRSGFRWAPSQSRWQRQLTDNAIMSANYLMDDIYGVVANLPYLSEVAKATATTSPLRVAELRKKLGDDYEGFADDALEDPGAVRRKFKSWGFDQATIDKMMEELEDAVFKRIKGGYWEPAPGRKKQKSKPKEKIQPLYGAYVEHRKSEGKPTSNADYMIWNSQMRRLHKESEAKISFEDWLKNKSYVDALVKDQWRKIVQKYDDGSPTAAKQIHAKGLELVPGLRLQDRITAVRWWLADALPEFAESAEREGRITGKKSKSFSVGEMLISESPHDPGYPIEVMYRGKIGDFVAMVIHEGMQMTIPVAWLKRGKLPKPKPKPREKLKRGRRRGLHETGRLGAVGSVRKPKPKPKKAVDRLVLHEKKKKAAQKKPTKKPAAPKRTRRTKKSQYQILVDKQPVTVDAIQIVGVWGFHEDDGGDFSIHHIPSGARIGERAYRSQAKRLLKFLGDSAPDIASTWEIGKKPRKGDPEIQEFMEVYKASQDIR